MIWVEGVTLAPAVGACGMWKEEDGGRPSTMKEGLRRGGGGAASKE